MIRMKEFKKVAKNRFPLKEMTMEQINSFDVEREFYPHESDPDDILAHWELIYELEYKLSMLKSRPFSGLEKRQENIIKIMERKLKEAILAVADTLQVVFEDWLSAHAITKPKEWAEARFYEGGDSIAEIEGFEMASDILLGELQKYRKDIQDISDLVMEVVNINPDVLDENFLDLVVQDEYTIMVDELEYSDIEEFNERFSSLLNKEFEDEEEARDFLDDNFSSYNKDFFKIMGGKKEALTRIVEMLVKTEFFSTGNVERALNIDDFFMIAYEKIVFPAWFDFWKSKGIIETRKNIEKITKQLSSIEKLPLEKQTMTLNIAKNANHQSGSMMEYYEEMWELDYVALEKLSNMDVSEWNEELREIGVVI